MLTHHNQATSRAVGLSPNGRVLIEQAPVLRRECGLNRQDDTSPPVAYVPVPAWIITPCRHRTSQACQQVTTLGGRVQHRGSSALPALESLRSSRTRSMTDVEIDNSGPSTERR